jgi:signal transduction histidine kinase
MTITSRSSSLRWRLPLLILALLASIGGAFAWTAHREMRHALRLAGDDRVHDAATKLADLLAQSAAARVAESRRLAADAAIRRFVLTGEDPDAAVLVLRTAGQRNPQAKVWLRVSGGTEPLHRTIDNVTIDRAPRASDPPAPPADGVGPLRLSNGHVTYTTTAVIAPAPGQPAGGAGVLSIERPLSSSAGATFIERLIGSGAALKFGNATGDLWTDLSAPVPSPPRPPAGAAAISFTDAAGRRRLGTAVPIGATPWQAWVDFSEASLMQPADMLLRRMWPWTAGLILLGVLAIWILSVRITAPLEQVADAADAIASGDYSRRVTVSGRDEIGRLGSAFNVMAARLAESRDALEARVEARTQELSASNRELEAFSYSVSHDLRAPLRSIDGFSQALLEDCGDRLEPEGQAHLRRIRAAAQHMGRLIDDLLKLARVSRADLRVETVDLSAMAQATMAALTDAHGDRTVDWHVHPGLEATGDARLLQVMLTNLLENAWKFTGKTAEARIEFGARGANGTREYYVKDNGAGFDPTYAAKLFGAFQRLHHPGDFPGTGIGLATVQRIVTRHGGRVTAEGAVGSGATFAFTLRPEAPL